jgi:hypothetical protein
MEIIQTEWGPMERWRAAALCIGQISNIVARADSAKAARQRADAAQPDTAPSEDKPPPADAVETAAPQPSIDAEHLATVEATVDALTARVDRMEAARRAEAALEALEDAIEVANPLEPEAGMTLQ